MSCPRCPHCIAAGAFGVLDPSDPALTTNQPRPKKIHMAVSNTRSACGKYAFRYLDKRSGASTNMWPDVTCAACLATCSRRAP